MNDMLYQNKYRISSTRLKNYDYSNNGAYFVTICTHKHHKYFGMINSDKMVLNNIGVIANNLWQKIPDHFQTAVLDSYVIMPNHIHGIIIINDKDANKTCDASKSNDAFGRDAINRVSTNDGHKPIGGGVTKHKNPMLHKCSLSKIIRWYKGRTKFEINKLNDKLGFVWQSRFYDHIIRNEKSFNHIREYILYNPLNWIKDEGGYKTPISASSTFYIFPVLSLLYQTYRFLCIPC